MSNQSEDDPSTTRAADAEPSPAELAAADDLAYRLIAAAAPLRLTAAQSAAEREAIYRLRYRTVLERGWAPPDTMPEGMVRDLYDDHAIHIVAWDEVVLAATARLVLPQPGVILPTEQAFDLVIEPRGRVADMGRQIVTREYTSMRHRVFGALLAKTWLEMRVHEYSLVCGDFSPGALRLYRILGFEVQQLGPSRSYWGEERFPILVDVSRTAMKLLERWG